MKQCRRCLNILPLEAFHKAKRNKDGLKTLCVDCDREVYGASYSRWKKQNKEHHAKLNRKCRKKRPDKVWARNQVRQAVRSGTTIPVPCPCGSPYSQAHHHDYSKPLDVVWLCAKCHGQEHRAYKPEDKS